MQLMGDPNRVPYRSAPAICGSWKPQWNNLETGSTWVCGTCSARFTVVRAMGRAPQAFSEGGQIQLWLPGQSGMCECTTYWAQM